MKLKHFQTNKEVYKIEIERLLIYYKAIYRLGIEQKNKINKQIIRNKKDKIKSIEVDINNLRDKISNLDTLYRFINGEPFKVEQLKTIVVEKVITENDILHELVDSIEEKIDIIIDTFSDKDYLLNLINNGNYGLYEDININTNPYRQTMLIKNTKAKINEIKELMKIAEIKEEEENE